jgi:alginate O-acetyltransferase complex protein AlgI
MERRLLFTEPAFFALLAITFSAYWLMPAQTARLVVLATASAVFYAWSHPPSLLLLSSTILLNYGFGRILAQNQSKWLLSAIIIVNLSALAWFKYAGFFTHEWNAAMAAFGWQWRVPQVSTWLPLGISFFTFQVIAYQVDVYRREVPAERSLLVFAVFKSFFAQLIAGPIVRARDFLPALRMHAHFDAAQVHRGVFLFLCGLGIKLGVADVLAQFADAAFARGAAQTTSEAWLGLYAYSLQLFADFWGYSTMAVGAGALFGLELPVNFLTPYRAQSIQDFWRRWHITLSSWFRDYLYIPLGGNRAPLRNVIITMTLAGLWHGAGWGFIIWGLAHGTWLALERVLRPYAPRLPGAVKSVLVFHGVCLCWVLFRAATLESAGVYYSRLFLPPYTANPAVPEVLTVWLIGFYLLHPLLARVFEPSVLNALSVRRQVATVSLLLLLALAYGGASYDFIYFRF